MSVHPSPSGSRRAPSGSRSTPGTPADRSATAPGTSQARAAGRNGGGTGDGKKERAKRGSLQRSLGLWAIVALGLGYMTPTVVFDTFGIVSGLTNGAVPSAYAVALVIMLMTAISYGKMVRAFPAAGSAYTYVRESMHPNLGFMVGWVALLDYLFLPMVNVLILRLYMEQMVPGVPPWIWVALASAFMTAVVAYSMRSTANVNMVLLTIALLVIAVFIVLTTQQLSNGEGLGTIASINPFAHTDVHLQAVIMGATVVCFSFIGFDAVTMYVEEAKSPRIMPRAILLTVFIGGFVFLIASYFAQLRFPDNSAFGDFVDDPLPQIGHLVGGPWFQLIFVAAGFLATVASGLASHASVSRMLLVMGRRNVLPQRFFGFVSAKTHTPLFNVVLVGLISLLAVNFDLELISALINFGALIAFTFVNASVIAHFAVRRRRRKRPKDIFHFIVMPSIAMGLTGLLWVNLHSEALIAGLIWAALGFGYLLYITHGLRSQPASFDEAEAENDDLVIRAADVEPVGESAGAPASESGDEPGPTPASPKPTPTDH